MEGEERAKMKTAAKQDRKRYRIARQGDTEAYSVQFYASGDRWETGLRNLDLKRATKQLERLAGLGCPTVRTVAVLK